MNDFSFVLAYFEVLPRHSNDIVDAAWNYVVRGVDEKISFGSLLDWIHTGLGNPHNYFQRIAHA